MDKFKLKLNEADFYNQRLTFFNYKSIEKVPGYNGVFYYSEPMDSFLHSSGIVGLATTKIRFLLDSGAYVTCNTIVHDSYYDSLPEYVREFLFAHEIAHIQNKDLELSESKLKRVLLKRSFGILPKMEVQADSFAASIIGVDCAKRAMKFLINNTDLPFISKFELKRRYRKIK